MKYSIVNHPDEQNIGSRVIGIHITEQDEPRGKYGLSEPCAWLRKVFEDAARYQWIKTQSELESYGGWEYCLPAVLAWDIKPGAELNKPYESLDEAVDAAIKGQ